MLPFQLDAALSIALALGCFIAGISVIARRPSHMGPLLFGLMAGSLGIWCAAGWSIGLSAEGVIGQAVWSVIRLLSIFLAPAIAVHVAIEIAHRRDDAAAKFIYLLSAAVGLAFTLGLCAALVPGQANLATNLLTATTGVSLLSYIGACLFILIELYPSMFRVSSRMEHRRATYAILLLVLFLSAGGAQLVTAVPAWSMAALSSAFLALSLLAFLRVSWLDVELDPLVVLSIPLLILFILSCLRVSSLWDLVSLCLGAGVIGSLSWFALRGSSRMQTQSEFIDLVAHQLRTPLGGIRAAASMLANGDHGQMSLDGIRTAQLIQAAATRLLTMSDAFLDAGQIELGSYRPKLEQTDVTLDVASIVQELSFIAQGTGTRIEQVVDPALHAVRLDKEVFLNTLFNLLDNALKHAPGSRVRVVCEISGSRLICSVSDTGPGIAPAELDGLFAKFARGQAAQEPGVGLGLYIAKRLVEAAGGSLSASSDGSGNGATFRFELPIERFDGARAGA